MRPFWSSNADQAKWVALPTLRKRLAWNLWNCCNNKIKLMRTLKRKARQVLLQHKAPLCFCFSFQLFSWVSKQNKFSTWKKNFIYLLSINFCCEYPEDGCCFDWKSFFYFPPLVQKRVLSYLHSPNKQPTRKKTSAETRISVTAEGWKNPFERDTNPFLNNLVSTLQNEWMNASQHASNFQLVIDLRLKRAQRGCWTWT